MRDVLSSGVEERVREVADRSKRRHREPRLRGRAVISARVGVRDLALVLESNQTLANHEVPQGDSPAEDGAGSLTPFGMTISSSHTPSSAPGVQHGFGFQGLKPAILLAATARFCFAHPCLKAWARPCPFKPYL